MDTKLGHKATVLGFITGEGFQRLTELSFVFLGRMGGMSNPAVGEIMGIATLDSNRFLLYSVNLFDKM